MGGDSDVELMAYLCVCGGHGHKYIRPDSKGHLDSVEPCAYASRQLQHGFQAWLGPSGSIAGVTGRPPQSAASPAGTTRSPATTVPI
jgi:hypothetical protein